MHPGQQKQQRRRCTARVWPGARAAWPLATVRACFNGPPATADYGAWRRGVEARGGQGGRRPHWRRWRESRDRGNGLPGGTGVPAPPSTTFITLPSTDRGSHEATCILMYTTLLVLLQPSSGFGKQLDCETRPSGGPTTLTPQPEEEHLLRTPTEKRAQRPDYSLEKRSRQWTRSQAAISELRSSTEATRGACAQACVVKALYGGVRRAYKLGPRHRPPIFNILYSVQYSFSIRIMRLLLSTSRPLRKSASPRMGLRRAKARPLRSAALEACQGGGGQAGRVG